MPLLQGAELSPYVHTWIYLCLLDGEVKELLSKKLTILQFLGAFISLAFGASLLTVAAYHLPKLAVGIDQLIMSCD